VFFEFRAGLGQALRHDVENLEAGFAGLHEEFVYCVLQPQARVLRHDD
jgi:hypothetical protein